MDTCDYCERELVPAETVIVQIAPDENERRCATCNERLARPGIYKVIVQCQLTYYYKAHSEAQAKQEAEDAFYTAVRDGGSRIEAERVTAPPYSLDADLTAS